MLESTITTKIRKAVEARGGVVVKHHGGPYAHAGVADLLVCYRGGFVALEVKTQTGKATKLQDLFLERVSQAGGAARVVRSVGEALAVLDDIDRYHTSGRNDSMTLSG